MNQKELSNVFLQIIPALQGLNGRNNVWLQRWVTYQMVINLYTARHDYNRFQDILLGV